MAVLTDRLNALAQQINEGETMADIGTDHGFLPIFLHADGISPKVVMTDVSEKSLSKAKENGRGVTGLDDSSFRCGDGLAPIGHGEVDAVVMAGMGGVLMVEILSADLPKSRSMAKFILQPRNRAHVLRRWLAHNGFSIVKEVLVRERHNLCEIIVASPDGAGPEQNWVDKAWPDRDIRWEVPPMYESTDDPLAEEYLHRKLEREKRVLREVRKAQSLNLERLKELDDRIAYLKDLWGKRRSTNEV